MKSTFEYRSGTISYSSRGDGDLIVLLHGYLESERIWESFATKLSQKFRVICIDLPGHGSSGTYGEIHTMEFMAGAVKDLADCIGVKKFFLAGHSLGGYVTLAFLELYPDYLSGYCLFHSQPFSDPPQVIEKRKREIELVKAGKKNLMYPQNVEKMYATSNLSRFTDAVRKSMEIAAEIPAKGIIAVLNGMMARPSRLNILESGRIPLLWILGSQDNYIQLDILDKVSLPENAEVVILINSGHMGFVEEEKESQKAIEDFILRMV